MSHLSLKQIEILKSWTSEQFPTRAIRWAQMSYPVKEPEYRQGMSFTELKYMNRAQPKVSLDTHIKILKTHKGEYRAFLAEHKIIPSIYDRFI